MKKVRILEQIIEVDEIHNNFGDHNDLRILHRKDISKVKCEVIVPYKQNFTRQEIIDIIVLNNKQYQAIYHMDDLKSYNAGTLKMLGIDFDTEILPKLK